METRSESISEESDSSAINSSLRNEASSPEGASEVSNRELDNHSSEKPSAKDVSSSAHIGGYGNQGAWNDSTQAEAPTAN